MISELEASWPCPVSWPPLAFPSMGNKIHTICPTRCTWPFVFLPGLFPDSDGNFPFTVSCLLLMDRSYIIKIPPKLIFSAFLNRDTHEVRDLWMGENNFYLEHDLLIVSGFQYQGALNTLMYTEEGFWRGLVIPCGNRFRKLKVPRSPTILWCCTGNKQKWREQSAPTVCNLTRVSGEKSSPHQVAEKQDELTDLMINLK